MGGIKNMSKIYEYKGFKIHNSPYGSEARWFITSDEMFAKYPKKTLKECKESIDLYLKTRIV